MSKFGKWLGGGLGCALGGPIGGLIGFALGAVLDDSGTAVRVSNTKYHTQRGDFSASLIILVASVMKADGRVMKAELDYVKTFFVKHSDILSRIMVVLSIILLGWAILLKIMKTFFAKKTNTEKKRNT